MSSLGLPGPSNAPPGDAALHRAWNRFLDDHNLRTVFQTSPAQIDAHCADALAALRLPAERAARVEDAILRLWDSIDLIVDRLPPHVNPHWRAEEQLLKPTALRLAARRARLADEDRERRELLAGFWDPMFFALDMSSAPSKQLETRKESGEKNKRKKREEKKKETIRVATSLVNTEYFLGHRPGDPIFSYDPRPALRAADDRNFTYRGCVPRHPDEDLLRLRLLLPRVLAQLVVLLAFSPENPAVVPVECAAMMDEVDGLGDGVLRTIWRCWRAKFVAGAATPYMHFLRGSPLVRELAWLVHAACRDDTRQRSPGEARRARRLWKTLLPVVDVLTSDRTGATSPCEALLRIAKLHVEDEGRRARDMVFREGDYGRALVYREGIVINKSIHALYASYPGHLRPTAGALCRTNLLHPLFSADPDLDDSDPVPIPDEVLAAYESIRARLEPTPEADADRLAPPPEPRRPELTIVVASAAAAEHRRRSPEDEDTCAAAQEPPHKRARH